ncbi:MAG TPA: SDR family NAD(P)-dependent oxidoreductase, partial [Steroidobacteraceae bacterium]|nr:SDR family NAD(P)-dependent oxidoreductase [Steroidobacteraceae bacterium]
MSAKFDPKQFIARPDLLADRVILITGASGGLGGALARDCARAGASVILSGRNGRKLDALYDQIEAAGGPKPALAPLDLASATAADYDALATTIEREF